MKDSSANVYHIHICICIWPSNKQSANSRPAFTACQPVRPSFFAISVVGYNIIYVSSAWQTRNHSPLPWPHKNATPSNCWHVSSRFAPMSGHCNCISCWTSGPTPQTSQGEGIQKTKIRHPKHDFSYGAFFSAVWACKSVCVCVCVCLCVSGYLWDTMAAQCSQYLSVGIFGGRRHHRWESISDSESESQYLVSGCLSGFQSASFGFNRFGIGFPELLETLNRPNWNVAWKPQHMPIYEPIQRVDLGTKHLSI